MKKFVKSNIKVLIAFTLGLLIAGITVYATTVLSGSDVLYNNESSKLTSTNVQDAIDEVYNSMVPIDPNTFKTNTAKTVYASSKGVCIVRNNKFNCFKTNNWDVEKDHVKQVFSDIGCDVRSSDVGCYASDFGCYVRADGLVRCRDISNNSYCAAGSDGYVDCLVGE